jgi:[ribosomal protein S5]-alanine N-acetyltransferase
MAGQVIQGRLISLRPLRRSDAEALDSALHDRRVTRFLPSRVRHETGRQFVTRVLSERRRGGGPAFAIRPADTEQTVGEIRFLNWSSRERRAEVGFWMRRKYWGRGFGTEALWLICRYGFRWMSLHRIDAVVVVGNLGSRRALEKVGFREEGVSRKSHRLGNGWGDAWNFGLLRGELLGPSERNRRTSRSHRPSSIRPSAGSSAPPVEAP